MLVLDRAKAGSGERGTGGRAPGSGSGEEAIGAGLTDAMFRDLPEYLRAGDLLVLNDSRVLPARLFAVRAGLGTQAGSPRPSGTVEVLLVEEIEGRKGGANPTSQNRDMGHPFLWRVLVKPAKKVRVGETLLFFEASKESDWELRTRGPGLKPLLSEPGYLRPKAKALGYQPAATPVLSAEVVEVGEFGERVLRFAPVKDFFGVVGRIGHMPLPPYIRRAQVREADSAEGFEAEDRERYQTVYAAEVGSAAAPTAGLHFTPEVLAALAARGVEIAYLTLHVGLGTFQPVRVEELKEIRLHSERYTLPAATADALNRAMAEGRRVVAVGTTTTRALEHMGSRLAVEGRFEAHSGSTSIFIGPGHRFRVVSGLLTNFHLPESTLLMLVAAFAAPPQGGAEHGGAERGRERVLAAYGHAVRAAYRFYSYGDCMLVV
jgi:S-adenosylmethionine:tRNA ribosyltransferase-isomerase